MKTRTSEINYEAYLKSIFVATDTNLRGTSKSKTYINNGLIKVHYIKLIKEI